MIVIVDYGVGNVAAVRNMFYRRGIEAEISGDRSKIADAERIVLPGVGAFDAAMTSLNKKNLTVPLREFAASGRPVIGICLGAQLLTAGSEEGREEGLGILDAHCIKFKTTTPPIKIPHMGWSEVEIQHDHEVLDFSALDQRPRFYFAHSYHFETSRMDIAAATTNYGYTFPSILAEKNVIAAQCHPEKSHAFGMRLLENFARWKYAKV